MTDLQKELNDLLKQFDVPQIGYQPLTLPRIDQFIDEAYKINARVTEVNAFLKSIRQSYLSQDVPHWRTHGVVKRRHEGDLSDREKEEIDAKTKQILRELYSSIRILAEAEDIRRQTELTIIKKKFKQGGLGALGSWAAGGAAQYKSPEQEFEESKINTIASHRENVLFFLRNRLQILANQQASMMEKRIAREVEKNRSLIGQIPLRQTNFLTDSPETGPAEFGASTIGFLEDQKPSLSEELSSEQIQMFEKDNQDMLRHYENTLNQVRTAEKSLVEISELQNQLVQNLTIQSAHIDQLLVDSHITTGNVGGGNIQLKEATRRKSTAKYVFYASCGLSLSTIIWDLFV